MMASSGTRVFLSSWLDKKMEWRFVYEHRFFILDGTRLSYRLEEHSAEKRFGTITSFEPFRESAKEETAKGYCFTVWLLEGGSWYLRAATKEIYDSWFRAIMTVLVPSANPSVAPSEGEGGDGQHSRVASSITEASAITSGGPSSQPLGNEGIGRNPGGRHQTPVRKATEEQPDPSNGGTPGRINGVHSPDGTSTAATATTAAYTHAADISASAQDTVLLSSMVEKEKAWRGQWRPRYMELREGRLLIIRSSAASASERQRYVVEAVDPSPMTAQATWMLISTSTGDRFWVRFGSVEERQRWVTVCGRLLLAECSWHWTPLAEDDAGRSWRLRQATSGSYDDLHVHYHCATMVPSFNNEVWCPSLFVFGGCERWCKSLFNPQARAFLPHTDATYTNGRLAAMELAGPHLVRPIQPAPFKEAPHALVRPLPRYGATLTCLPVAAPRPGGAPLTKMTEDGDTNGRTEGDAGDGAVAASATELLGARVVLLGGLTGGGYQPPATELWSVWRSKAACAPGVELRWGRQDLPSYELPNLAFHDAVYVSWGTHAPSQAVSTAAQPHDGFLLVTGGLDVEYRCRAECYAVVWNYDSSSAEAASTDAEERAYTALPTAYAFGQLPGPRAFHRMATLEDGTVVLVGGRGVENAPAAPSVLTLAPEVWRRAAKSWCPPPPAPSAPAEGTPHAPVEPASHKSENWCSLSSEEDHAPHSRKDEGDDDDADADAPASQWRRAHFDDTPLRSKDNSASTSTAQQLVKTLPSEMGDVAVAATGSGGRVVVMGQVTQPRQDVKLYLLDFEPVRSASSKISAGEQFPPGTRRVRCHEVLLFVGAVPNRVVGITLHVFNGYLYVIGGCTVDKSKTDSYSLCGPLRILLE
ncbi:hypothetical protein ABB37_02870 [Leptomonas pyrrhocoris]|uniref:PH domain-containing protein n=1 Tax=Leptomonas pyrrhocoris TaxID=157538 RepID=A0A0M9G6D0_LEPPY|nr:hypothetical protein ABB37_02870 [Leptomonas pyrrhocoris]KPA83179.1 hypothetical protein ABB37_02870 [Leptomonas pyrrhocoris]|eukprot:XP_015661618.1 hypothetical protein ABB37_02870 [Leptomonas pyrrhocoris]